MNFLIKNTKMQKYQHRSDRTDLLRVVPSHVRLVFDQLSKANSRVEHHRPLRSYHAIANGVVKVGDLLERLCLRRKLLGLLWVYFILLHSRVRHIWNTFWKDLNFSKSTRFLEYNTI